jgi:hypothetical protein
MVALIKAVTFDAMLDNWAKAELSHLAHRLPAETIGRYELGRETPFDKQIARYALFIRRRPVLIPFLAHETSWFNASLDVRALAETRSYLVDDERHVTLGELARGGGYNIPDFDPSLMRGFLIIVAARADGPWYLLEGTHRCVELLRTHVSGRTIGSAAVIAGLCAQLGEVIAKTVKPVEIDGAPV